MLYSNENHIDFNFSRTLRNLKHLKDAFRSCLDQQTSPPLHRSSRRRSYPDSSDISTDRRRRISRSEETRPSSSSNRGRIDTLSSENIKTTEDLRIHKDNQQSRSINRKLLTIDAKSDQTNLHNRTSNASTSEQVTVSRGGVVTGVQQSTSGEYATRQLKNKTGSFESVVRDPIEKPGSSRSANVRPNNYELVAAATPIVGPKYEDSTLRYDRPLQRGHTNPGPSNIQPYFSDYEFDSYRDEFNPPPPPAPPDTHQPTHFHIRDTYTNIILPPESSLEPVPRSILRKPSTDRLSNYIENDEFDTVNKHIYAEHLRVELPRLGPTDSPKRQRLSYNEPLHGLSHRRSLPYIDERVSRPFQRSSYPEIRTRPEIEQEDHFNDQIRLPQRRRPNLSARNFLELSPDFDEDFTIPIHQLPQEFFHRPVKERFLERYPHQVQVQVHERPSLSPTARSREFRAPRPLYSPQSSYRRPRPGAPEISHSFYANHNRDFMLMMNSLDEHDRKIIIEFCHLLEKSKQLFNGLRELPHYGHKQWHAHFGRTFDVYTKLWKFQQQHRALLDSKYGLKRWQIGEIASKIGQLYYHFYLRTSESAYLSEAHSFYYAIRGRSYYTKASREDKCELMVKKLRYYARYIVVCLLLKKIKLVGELLKELEKQIIEYGDTYSPDDQLEWTVVADEVRAFIKALPVVTVFHPDSYPVVLSHRLNPQTTPPVDRNSFMTLVLQEVLVVGSNLSQVKFSELTMDMFRIIQTLEREPSGDIQHMYDESPRQRYPSTPSAANSKGYNLECAPNRAENPHKYLLFKPSPSQIFVYLASACSDLPPNGALLLYLSAEGQLVPPPKQPSEDAGGYESGGLITSSKSEVTHKETTKDGKPVQPKHKDHQVLHPGDLYPFTRRPMFLIIDSDNSYIFQNMPRYFGQPLVILMSPVEEPASLHASVTAKRQNGSLFTLFLHCPLSALCYCCDIPNMSLGNWERAQCCIDNYLAEASQIFTRARADMIFMAFMGDDFFRLLILRYIFCETVLRMHRAFRSRNHLTRSSPNLPDDLFEHPALTRIVMDLASLLQVRGHFHDPSVTAPPPPQNKE